ncbi:MAG: hypothetical protein J2P15_13585, partial [Micromonosporaceae bacterium]|nr:hypothetical protein [Micromonosporaceae bacterium]
MRTRAGRCLPAASLVLAALSVAVAIGSAASIGYAAPVPRDTGPVLPSDPGLASGLDAGDQSPTPAQTPTDPPSPTPTELPPVSPTPAPPPPPAPPPVQATGAPVLRLVVATGAAVLDASYWTGRTATSLTITVANNGNVAARVRLRTTAPAGVTLSAGGCGDSCDLTVGPGRRQSVRVNLSVSPQAWRRAPLTGGVSFSASAAGVRPVGGDTNWDVVFPPGPPTPGISLQVGTVALGAEPEAPGRLTVRVGNTGHRRASVTVTVLVPQGVSFAAPPAGCVQHPEARPLAMDCALGRVPPGGTGTLTVGLLVDGRARADSPLAGLVRVVLTPDGRAPIRTQGSYLIVASGAGVSAGNPAGASGPPTASVVRHPAPLRRPAVVGLVTGGSLVLLAVLAGMLVTLTGWGVPARGALARLRARQRT